MEKMTLVASMLKPDLVIAMALSLTLNTNNKKLETDAFKNVSAENFNVEVVDLKYNYADDSQRQKRRVDGENIVFFDVRNYSSAKYKAAWYYKIHSLEIKSLSELVWKENRKKYTNEFFIKTIDRLVGFVNNLNKYPKFSVKDLQYRRLVDYALRDQHSNISEYKLHTSVDTGPSYLPKFIIEKIIAINKIRNPTKKAVKLKALILDVSQKLRKWYQEEIDLVYLKENMRVTHLSSLVDLLVLENSRIPGQQLKYLLAKIYSSKSFFGGSWILVSTYNKDMSDHFNDQLNININLKQAVASLKISDLYNYLSDFKIPSFNYKIYRANTFVSIAKVNSYLEAGILQKIEEFICQKFVSSIDSSEKLLSQQSLALINTVVEENNSLSPEKIILIRAILKNSLSDSVLDELTAIILAEKHKKQDEDKDKKQALSFLTT